MKELFGQSLSNELAESDRLAAGIPGQVAAKNILFSKLWVQLKSIFGTNNWTAREYKSSPCIVVYNKAQYILDESVAPLPFNSTDFATELASNIWLPLGSSGASTAANVIVDPTGFDGNLDSTVTNVQILAQKVDDLTIASDVETLNVTTTLQTNKLLKVNATGDGVDYTDFNADSVLQTDAIDYSSPAWMVGESRLLLTTKVSTTEGNFEGAAELMDLILPPAVLATLESSDANWTNETKIVTGDNSTYALGRTGQFGWLSDRTFVQCTSATYAVSGSATFNRNRAIDALSISDTQDLAVINLLEPSRTGGTDDDGWNLTTQTKVITTVACKVGTYWVGGTNGSGNWFTCFAQSGTNYYWKRLGTPDSVQRPITTASHPTLTSRLLAKADWGTSLYTVQAGDETSYQDQTFWNAATRAYYVKVTTTQWEKIK